MNYKQQEFPLEGEKSTYRRFPNFNFTAEFGEIPNVKLKIEDITTYPDGFYRKENEHVIYKAMTDPTLTFDWVNAETGIKKQTLTYGELYEILLSLGIHIDTTPLENNLVVHE